METTDTVVCYCLQCKLELGSFKNSWNGIGTTYISPAYPPVAYVDGFIPTGNVYQAATASRIENSFLEDLACKKCGTLLGLRCDSAPDGHLLKKNQLIMKFATISLVSEHTGKEVKPLVAKTFPLTVPGMKKPPIIRRAATTQPSLPQLPGLQDRPIRRQSVMPTTNGNMSSLSEVESENDLVRFRAWAKDAITSQQNDIDRIQGAVSRIERDMNSFKNFMAEVRNEMAISWQSRQPLDDEALVAIREDMESLRQQVHATERRVTLSFEDATKDVRIANRKSDEFSGVKKDLQCLKSRIESLEMGNGGALVPINSCDIGLPAVGRSSLGGGPVQSSLMMNVGHEMPQGGNSSAVPKTPSMHPRPEEHRSAPEAASRASHTLQTGPERWCYTGPHLLPNVRSACDAFGMARSARTTRNAIERLENHVNESQQQYTPNGLIYGMVKPVDGTTVQKSKIPKRTHEEMQGADENSFIGQKPQFILPQKIRKISAGSAKRSTAAVEKPATLPDRSSSLNNTSEIGPRIPESSPILGDYDDQGEFLYARKDIDIDYQPSSPPKSQDSPKQPSRTTKRLSLTTATPNAASKRIGKRRKSSLATTKLSNTIDKENENDVSSEIEGVEMGEESILPSIEKDDALKVVISPPPPTSDPATAGTPPTPAAPRAAATSRIARPVKPVKPFKCGVCGKRWKNLDGLRYHKKHCAECEFSGDDEAPKLELKCKSCGKKYTSSQGLGYHLQNSYTCCNNWDDFAAEMQTPAPSSLAKGMTRTSELAAREKLVQEALAREN